MTEQRFDTWAAGDAYNRYMGRWSRLVAAEFVGWLGREDGLRWVDVGCGTGALTATVLARCRPRTVLGVDRSPGFVLRARAATSAPAWFVVADAQSLPVRDAAFDVAVSGPALNFVPAPDAAVAEATRVVRPATSPPCPRPPEPACTTRFATPYPPRRMSATDAASTSIRRGRPIGGRRRR